MKKIDSIGVLKETSFFDAINRMMRVEVSLKGLLEYNNSFLNVQ